MLQSLFYLIEQRTLSKLVTFKLIIFFENCLHFFHMNFNCFSIFCRWFVLYNYWKRADGWIDLVFGKDLKSMALNTTWESWERQAHLQIMFLAHSLTKPLHIDCFSYRWSKTVNTSIISQNSLSLFADRSTQSARWA